jgi:hypothetical protein
MLKNKRKGLYVEPQLDLWVIVVDHVKLQMAFDPVKARGQNTRLDHFTIVLHECAPSLP